MRLHSRRLALWCVSPSSRSIPASWRATRRFYADTGAYEAHVQTPHFLKYKTGTQGMVKSLTLLETDPVLLAAKPK